MDLLDIQVQLVLLVQQVVLIVLIQQPLHLLHYHLY